MRSSIGRPVQVKSKEAGKGRRGASVPKPCTVTTTMILHWAKGLISKPCRPLSTIFTIKSSIGRSCRKCHFCHDKSMCLSQQNASFVATKVCSPRQNICRNKIMFAATKYFCCVKTFVATNICRNKHVSHDKSFVATSILLSQQKWYLGQLLPMIFHILL